MCTLIAVGGVEQQKNVSRKDCAIERLAGWGLIMMTDAHQQNDGGHNVMPQMDHQDALFSALEAVEGQEQHKIIPDEGEQDVAAMAAHGTHVVGGSTIGPLVHPFTPGIQWVDRGILKEVEFGKMRLSFKGFLKEGLGRVDVGSFVYLTPAEPNMPMFIGQLQELFSLPREDTQMRGNANGTFQDPFHKNKEGLAMESDEGIKMGVFAWYSRPEELELDAPLPIFEHEVFAVDDVATIPLDLVCGLCDVLSPGAFQSRQRAGADLKDVYVCWRKYVSEEGRVVPLEGKQEEVGDGSKEFILMNKKVERNPEYQPAPDGKKGKSSAEKPARTSRRKRKERDPYSPEKTVVRTKGGRVVHPPKDSFSYADIDDGNFEAQAETYTKAPKSKYGRWTPERYHAAQAALVEILKQLGAVHPHKAILRPRLREEARRGVGDTGLLDYLLKHLADETVSDKGEKLRRRHNRNGHMEYWLQDPESALVEEKMLNEEMTALSAELREIREARNLIQTVRDEAASAVKTIQTINTTPGSTKHEVVDNHTPYELPPQIQDALSSMRNMFASMLQQTSKEGEALKEQLDTLTKDHNEMKKIIDDQAALIEKLTQDVQSLTKGAEEKVVTV